VPDIEQARALDGYYGEGLTELIREAVGFGLGID